MLTELGPQLGALSTEVALLAARADSADQPNAVLEELVRLGEDVERLRRVEPIPRRRRGTAPVVVAQEPGA